MPSPINLAIPHTILLLYTEYECNNGITIKILEFQRDLDPYTFINWISMLKSIFAYKPLPEEKKV